MKSRRFKAPNGRRLRHTSDKLAQSLAAIDWNIPAQTADFTRLAPDTASENGPFAHYQTDAFDIRMVAGTIVTVFGAGSVGSYLSQFLGPAQLQQNVVDFKKVELKHTQGGRTIYDHTLIGMKKVDALKRKLERDHVGTTVNPLPYNVAELPNIELVRMFNRSWLVFLAIDDPKQILRISDLAYSIVEVIQVAVHAKARSGHLAISIPLVTPCIRCTLEIHSEKDIRRLDGEPGNSLDIAHVAQEAARIGLDILYSKATGKDITRWDVSKNLIYISNTKQEELSPDGPGLHFEGSQRRAGCLICNI